MSAAVTSIAAIVSASRTTACTPAGVLATRTTGLDAIGIGEEQRALHPQDDDASRGTRTAISRAIDVAVRVRRVEPSSATCGPGRLVDEEDGGGADADEQPGKGVEDDHSQEGGQRGEEVGPGGRPVDLLRADR